VSSRRNSSVAATVQDGWEDEAGRDAYRNGIAPMLDLPRYNPPLSRVNGESPVLAHRRWPPRVTTAPFLVGRDNDAASLPTYVCVGPVALLPLPVLLISPLFSLRSSLLLVVACVLCCKSVVPNDSSSYPPRYEMRCRRGEFSDLGHGQTS
jgi:hypothetical protein